MIPLFLIYKGYNEQLPAIRFLFLSFLFPADLVRFYCILHLEDCQEGIWNFYKKHLGAVCKMTYKKAPLQDLFSAEVPWENYKSMGTVFLK